MAKKASSAGAKAKAAPAAPISTPAAAAPTPAPAPAPKAVVKPAAPKAIKPVVTKEMISKRAYEIWVSKGRPVGLDLENWQQAERELGVV